MFTWERDDEERIWHAEAPTSDGGEVGALVREDRTGWAVSIALYDNCGDTVTGVQPTASVFPTIDVAQTFAEAVASALVTALAP